MTGTRARAGLHARKSYSREIGQSASVAYQLELEEALAARLDADVVEVYVEDDTSAFRKRLVTLPSGRRVKRNVRPDWQRALGHLYTGHIDILVEYDLDRAFREPRDLEDLIEIIEITGRRVESVTGSLALRTDSDISNARYRVIAANDFSRSRARYSTAGASSRARLGRPHGGRRAYGYTPDGLHLVEGEALDVTHVFTEFLAGVPLAAIARDLTVRGRAPVGWHPPLVVAWSPTTVRDMLARPRYAGLVVHRGDVVPGVSAVWPSVVEEDTWRIARSLLGDPGRRTSTGNRASALLSGYATCGYPGCNLRIISGGVKSGRRRDGTPKTPYRMYRCRTGHLWRRLDWVDHLIEQLVVARLSRPDATGLFTSDRRGDAAALRREAAAIQARLEEMAVLLADLSAPLPDRGAVGQLQARLAEVEGLLGRAGDREPILGDLVRAHDPGEVWAGMGLDRRRAVVAALMKVELLPGWSGRRGTGDLDRDTLELAAPFVKVWWL